jgi:hypothetical protein
MIAGFSGHVPGLRTEAICGLNFKNSLAEADAARPRVGNLENQSTQVVKPMPKSNLPPHLATDESLTTIADKFPLLHEPTTTRIAAGYAGHIPGKETASWRWVGKPWSKGVNHGGPLSSGGSTFENFYPGGMGRSASQPGRYPEPTDSIGGPMPGGMTQNASVPNHLAAQSWRATGSGFQGYGTGRGVGVRKEEQFMDRDARFKPCSGYSGHVRGLVGQNIIGRSFAETVAEAKQNYEYGEEY